MLKHYFIGFALLVALGCVGCGGNKALGQACSSDRECANGICLDLSHVEQICSGRVCTATCTQASDCPAGNGRPDCHVFSSDRPNACLYADWVGQHCRMPAMPSP
jgi:hypothetical protein